MSPSSDQTELKAATFDVIQRRERVALFKIGKLWVFKHFLDDKETFKALAEFYNGDKFRFEFKTFGERNNALKILEKAGFEYELVEDLRPFGTSFPDTVSTHPCLRTLLPIGNIGDWRIFLMKDSASVEEAARMGAKMYQGDYNSLVFR